MPLDELKPSDFPDYQHYIKYKNSLTKARNEHTLKCEKYPAGRNRTLVIKTIKTKKKPKQKNDRRLCLTNITSNPNNISLVMLKQTDRQFTLWLYPEGRRLSSEEIDRLLSSLLAFKKFDKILKKIRVSKKLPKNCQIDGNTALKYLSRITKFSRYGDVDFSEKVQTQTKRILRKYTKFLDSEPMLGED